MTAKKKPERLDINEERLMACPGPHDLVAMDDLRTRMSLGFQCLVCDGIVTATAARWYQLGLMHAKKVKK